MARAMIFAHFDSLGEVDPFVARSIDTYLPLFDKVVVVSTSASAWSRSDGRIEFISRENIGYDFGSWRVGLNTLDSLKDFDEIVLANDSVYGPLSSLESVFLSQRLRNYDMWGMVRSSEIRPHLQSWFLVFGKRAIESVAFHSFWNSVVPQASKDEVIRRYEIGLTEAMESAGLKVGAVYDDDSQQAMSLVERLGNTSWRDPLGAWKCLRRTRSARWPLNPTCARWRAVLRSGVPFLKSGLFKANPYSVYTAHALSVVEDQYPEWSGLIRGHLRRVLPDARW